MVCQVNTLSLLRETCCEDRCRFPRAEPQTCGLGLVPRSLASMGVFMLVSNYQQDLTDLLHEPLKD